MSGWSLSDVPFIIFILALAIWALKVIESLLWYRWGYWCFTNQSRAMARLTKLMAGAEQSVRLFSNGFHIKTDDDTLKAYQRLIQEIREAAKRGVEIVVKIHDEPPASLLSLAQEGVITLEQSAQPIAFTLWVIDEERVCRSVDEWQKEMFAAGWYIHAPQAYNIARGLEAEIA